MGSDDFTNAESIIEFPIAVNTAISDIEHEFEPPEDEIIQYHIGKNDVPIPVYCADSKPFDVKRALINTVQCPIRYLSKAPPTLVTENYCFVVDGDLVDYEAISKESSVWWNDTGTATRYYSTDCFRTFYQVTMLMSRGQLRSAYRHRQRGAGMEQVGLNKVFRVSRYFSYWKSCRSFHRIISLVSPVTEDGEKEYGFKKRIFIQYLWRSDQKADKERVALEFASSTSSPTTRRRKQFSQMPRNSIDILPPIPTFLGSMTSSDRSLDTI